jgi:tripartite-type tricarboxylate transporter receptor subunit TctC
MARIELTHVPYNGSSAAYQDLIGRRLELAFVTLDSALPLARAGQIKVLGVASAERSRAHPRYPAIAETVPGYEASGFFGFMAPAGTPPDVVERLADELIAVLREPSVARRLHEAGMEVTAERPAAFDAYLRREIERYAELARRSGLRIE